ncbi:HNH endonuclease signature motif containing protein [Enterobacter sichuanensis]|uniref:HNH endonuclease signature motif containing protein n=1 Tax=Enterobacter sichuanensis TaxID=2071710 RepID=UPI0011B09C82|nr:HNH endonuclease signature motif containing protein [Enterobacter sichuanensis]MDR0173130.1 HNH endonuclease signature motif containing protein [Enterobacter sichuanensis]
MFRLYKIREFERNATLLDFERIVSPKRGLELACYYYVLDYEEYNSRLYFDIPKRKWNGDRHSSGKYKRKSLGYYDPIYDDVERELSLGQIIAVDRGEYWTWYNNPFYFDNNGEIVYDPFMPGPWESSFRNTVMSAYHEVLERNRGIKPRPTQKIQYGAPGYVEPEQHAQSSKTLNSRNVGRLLAAGGVYNGNIEGFRKTAEQLGGEALEGYKGVMTDTNIGMGIAAASILLVKNPMANSELSGYIGKVKNTKVFMDNVNIENITYIRRPREEYITLRNQFDNSVRKNFLKKISTDASVTDYFNEEQIGIFARGGVPKSWQVHHKLPLDDGGDNSFENLILMKTSPYHQVLNNTQALIIKQLRPGESMDVLWPMPNGSIYKK